MNMGLNALSEVATLTEDDIQASKAGDLSVIGFSIMCAWHFLIIFYNMPGVTSGDADVAGRLFPLHLTLYLALAVSYCIIAFASKVLTKTLFRSGTRHWTFANIAIGIVASASSLFATYASSSILPLWLQIIAYALLGFSEAMLMFPWLQLPQVKDDRTGSYRNLAFNMGIGGVIALVIGNLEQPFIFVAACVLPIIANTMLVMYWANTDKLSTDTNQGIDSKYVFTPSETVITNLHFIVYGLAFGICQAVFSQAPAGADFSITYVIGSVWPLLGAAISAVAVFGMPTRFFKTQGVLTVQRFGMIVLLAGAFLSLYFLTSDGFFDYGTSHWGNIVGQTLFFTGFNIFDFGFMVFAFTWAARLRTDFTAYIGFNRTMLYASMGAGLGIGFLLVWALPTIPNLLIATAAVVALLLMFTTLPFFDEFAPYGKIASVQTIRREVAEEEKREEEERKEVHAARWRERVEAIADEYNLSKREREVFRYLAKGRNAAFIQQELWISIHTVKTHMFNIYRKLDVHSIQDILDMVDANPDKDNAAATSEIPNA